MPVYGSATRAWDIVDVADFYAELEQPSKTDIFLTDALTDITVETPFGWEGTLDIIDDASMTKRNTYLSPRRLTEPDHWYKINANDPRATGNFALRNIAK